MSLWGDPPAPRRESLWGTPPSLSLWGDPPDDWRSAAIRAEDLTEEPQGWFERLVARPLAQGVVGAPAAFGRAGAFLTKATNPALLLMPSLRKRFEEGVERDLGPSQRAADLLAPEAGHNVFERALQGMLAQSPQLVATIASGPAAALTGGAFVAAESEREALERGVDPNVATGKALVEGSIGGVLEAIGVGKLSKLLKPLAKSERTTRMRQLLSAAGFEAGEEEAEELVAVALESATGKQFAPGEILERATVAPLAGGMTAGGVRLGGAGLDLVRRARFDINVDPDGDLTVYTEAGSSKLRDLPEDLRRKVVSEANSSGALPPEIAARLRQITPVEELPGIGRGRPALEVPIEDAGDVRPRRLSVPIQQLAAEHQMTLLRAAARQAELEGFPDIAPEPLPALGATKGAWPEPIELKVTRPRNAAEETRSPAEAPPPQGWFERFILGRTGEEGAVMAGDVAGAGRQISDWFRRSLTTRRGLEEPEFQLRERFAQEVEAEVGMATWRADQLRAAKERALAQTPQAMRYQQGLQLDSLVDRYITDPEFREGSGQQLPEDLRLIADEIRGHIDTVTAKILSTNLISDAQRQVLEGVAKQNGGLGDIQVVRDRKGLGRYLRRSFAIHDDARAQFEAVGGQVAGQQWRLRRETPEWRGARDWLREQPGNEEWSTAKIDEELIDIFRRVDGEVKIEQAALGMFGDIDRASFKQRKDLDPRFRKLLGEYTNPEVSYLKTIERMARGYYKAKMYSDMIQGGMGRIFFESLPEGAVGGEYPSLRGAVSRGSITAQEILRTLTGKPLAGIPKGLLGGDLHVKDNMLLALDSGFESMNWLRAAAEHNFAAKPFWWATKASGMAKAGVTVYLPRTQLRNAVWSNPLALAGGGNLVPMFGIGDPWNAQMYRDLLKGKIGEHDVARGIQLALGKAVAGTGLGSRVSAETARDIAALNRLGVIGGNVDVGDSEFYLGDTRARFSNLDPGAAGWRRFKAKAKQALSVFPRSYVAGDDAWKAAAFLSEMKKLRWMKPGADEGALQLEAAELVKQTMQNYERIPKLIQAIRAVPVVGPFVAFPTASMINLKNQHMRAMREMGLLKPAEGSVLRSGGEAGWRQRYVGLHRLASLYGSLTVGASVAGTLVKGLVAAASPVLPDLELLDDEQIDPQLQKDFENAGPQYAAASRMKIVGRSKEQAGKFFGIDTSFIDYYNIASRPIIAAIRAGRFDENAWKAAFEEITKQYTDPDLFTGTIAELKTGKDEWGRTIYSDQSPLLERNVKILTHLMLETVGPANALWRIGHGAAGVPDFRGREYEIWSELFAQVTGPRIMTVDFARNVGHKGAWAASMLSEIENLIREKPERPGPVELRELEHTARFHFAAINRTFKRTRDAYQAALRQGVPAHRAQEELMSSHLRAEIKRGLMNPDVPIEELTVRWLHSRWQLANDARRRKAQAELGAWKSSRRQPPTPAEEQEKISELIELWRPVDLSWMVEMLPGE